jgi:hypothetical protein
VRSGTRGGRRRTRRRRAIDAAGRRRRRFAPFVPRREIEDRELRRELIASTEAETIVDDQGREWRLKRLPSVT